MMPIQSSSSPLMGMASSAASAASSSTSTSTPKTSRLVGGLKMASRSVSMPVPRLEVEQDFGSEKRSLMIDVPGIVLSELVRSYSRGQTVCGRFTKLYGVEASMDFPSPRVHRKLWLTSSAAEPMSYYGESAPDSPSILLLSPTTLAMQQHPSFSDDAKSLYPTRPPLTSLSSSSSSSLPPSHTFRTSTYPYPPAIAALLLNSRSAAKSQVGGIAVRTLILLALFIVGMWHLWYTLADDIDINISSAIEGVYHHSKAEQLL